MGHKATRKLGGDSGCVAISHEIQLEGLDASNPGVGASL